MRIIDDSGQPRAHLPSIEYRTLACANDGLATLSFWQQTFDAGAAARPHRYDC